MPGFDGTGPRGRGPGIGRGMGWCGAGKRPPGRWMFSLAAAAVGVVVKDAMNPGGLTRRAFRALGTIFPPRVRKPEREPRVTIRDAEVEILPPPRNMKEERSGNDASR